MPLTIDDITVIGRRVAAEFDDAVTMVSLASNQPDAGRIELLFTVDTREEPLRVLLNIARTSRAAFERTLRVQLQHALSASQP